MLLSIHYNIILCYKEISKYHNKNSIIIYKLKDKIPKLKKKTIKTINLKNAEAIYIFIRGLH